MKRLVFELLLLLGISLICMGWVAAAYWVLSMVL
jgi:hypothetical protein